MDPLFFALTAADVERELARRLHAARRAQGWTQADIALRSGLSLATVARLERTGQGQISSLTRLCGALNRLDDFEGVLRPAPPTTLDELRRRSA